MADPERFSNLPEYAFPRLRRLLADAPPPAGVDPVVMTIGEPRHAIPDFVAPTLARTVGELAKYPPNEGTPQFLGAVSGWLGTRYGLDIATDRITALNGSREGLFNAALALCPERKNGGQPVVLIPKAHTEFCPGARATVSL